MNYRYFKSQDNGIQPPVHSRCLLIILLNKENNLYLHGHVRQYCVNIHVFLNICHYNFSLLFKAMNVKDIPVWIVVFNISRISSEKCWVCVRYFLRYLYNILINFFLSLQGPDLHSLQQCS